MLTGNKGEWSEVYTFLYLVAEGKVYAADAGLNKLGENQFYPIKQIVRDEGDDRKISYQCDIDPVVISDNTKGELLSVPREEFRKEADNLYEAITLPRSEKGAFEVPETEAFMKRIFAGRLKSPSSNKADLVAQIHDPETGFDPICGWSIKSEIGNPPTLLNAGVTTNFRFLIHGITHEEADMINAINTKGKVKDRFSALSERWGVEFDEVANSTFDRNQKLIDTRFPEIMAEALSLYYGNKGRTCREVVDLLEENDPLHLGEGMYRFKFKKFLSAVALGMVPSKRWSGRDEASGGCVVVTAQGEVLAFYAYNRDEFEDYLLSHTMFETASTTRHGFGSVYWENEDAFINLNLQIRFIS